MSQGPLDLGLSASRLRVLCASFSEFVIRLYLQGPEYFGFQDCHWQTAGVEQPPSEMPSAAEEADSFPYSTSVPRKMAPVLSLLTPLPPPHCQKSYAQSSLETGALVVLTVLSAVGP